MSEQPSKPARTVAAIQGEYSALCTRAGHLQYQIYTHQKDLELVNNTLRDLNFEAAAVQNKEAQEKAKAEELAKAKQAGIESAASEAPKVTPIKAKKSKKSQTQGDSQNA